MRTLSVVMLGIFLVSVPVLLYAERFDIRGHEVNVTWEHGTNAEHQDIFIVRGNASKGKPCKKLELQFAFSNDNYKEYIPIAKAYIDNYDPAQWNDFSGEVVVKTDPKHIPTWGFIDSAVKCLE